MTNLAAFKSISDLRFYCRMAILEYPVTRPIYLSNCWKVVVILGAIVWTALITIVNIAAVGYEPVPFTSTSYNAPNRLWYEQIIPTSSSFSSSWAAKSRTCDASIIKLLEC